MIDFVLNTNHNRHGNSILGDCFEFFTECPESQTRSVGYGLDATIDAVKTRVDDTIIFTEGFNRSDSGFWYDRTTEKISHVRWN